jgi:two-component system, cell cycle response regulator
LEALTLVQAKYCHHFVVKMPTDATKVIIVDDDPAMLRLLAKWLEAEGYQVLRAGDGRMAMELIEAERPRLLVTDLEMPNIDGLELCRWVRTQNFGHYLYTIFLTVRTDSSDMIKGLEAGADDFLKKPLDRHELLARIRAGSRVMDLEKRLSVLANTDTLTGLATRRVLFDDIRREWHRAERYHTPVSCVMLDIDFFKRINDIHGHQAGDEVLRRVGQLLGSGVRTSDFIGRYGGEEFCIFMPETNEGQAVLWAERMRSQLAELLIVVNGSRLEITASFGVAQRLADTASPEALLEMADQALIVAKRSGRDRVVAYQALTQSPVPGHAPGDLESLLQNIPAKDVMMAIVAPLYQEHTVATAANYFLKFRIPTASVVDEQGQLVGILSEKDLMATMLGPQWWTIRIKDVMKRHVVCDVEETPALAIFEFLTRVVIRSVVIVKNGAPTGLITRGCLIRFLMNLLAARKTDRVLPDVDAAANKLVERMGNDSVQDRIAKTVRSLAAEACELQQRVGGCQGDLVPCMVGGASRVQELAIDLLAISRYAQTWAEESPATAAPESQVSDTMRFRIAPSDSNSPHDLRLNVAEAVG